MIQIGNVSSKATPAKHHAARNFPATASQSVIGSVISSSMLPLLRSSAHSRIEIAGMSTKYSQGCQRKNGCRSAWPRSSNPPT